MVRLDTQSIKRKTTTKKSLDWSINCMLNYQSTLVGNQFNSYAAVLYFLSPVQLCVGCYCLSTLEFDNKSIEGFVVFSQGKPGIGRLNGRPAEQSLNFRRRPSFVLVIQMVLIFLLYLCAVPGAGSHFALSISGNIMTCVRILLIKLKH